MRLLAVSVVLASLPLAAGCGSEDSPSGAAAGRAQMAALLDAVAADTGAVAFGEPAWYEPETLFEFINGMAAYYVDAGFVRVVHTEWAEPGAKAGAYVEMHVYDMGSPFGALDVLADARTPATVYLEIGDETHQADAGLDLRVGRYYARLVARKDVAGQKEFVKRLATALAKAAPPAPPEDQLLAPLPAVGRLPHSASYTTKGFLNRDGLQGVREAAYSVGGTRVRLFILEAKTADAARAVFAEWRDSLPPQAFAAGQDRPNTFTYTEAYTGPVTAVLKGRFVCGAIGDQAAARPMLDALVNRIE